MVRPDARVLADARTAQLLDEVCDVDLDAFNVDLPQCFGRDRNARRTRPHAGTMENLTKCSTRTPSPGH